MRSQEIEAYKARITLSECQRDILIGLLLGDGHLETQNNGRTYRLKVEHSGAQQAYMTWLYDEFRPWIRGDLYRKVRKDGRTTLGFSTYSHGTFRFYAQQFYASGKKKRMPPLMKKLLTPLGLAVWFMDDGSFKSNRHRTYIFHTLGYAKCDLELMQQVLLEKFGIETSLHAQKGKYWRLYIRTSSAKTFKEIVRPHLHASMLYKLGNKHA